MTTGLFLLLRHFFPRCSFRFHKITLNLNNAPGKPGGMTSINQFSQFDCLKLKFYFFNGRMKKKKKKKTKQQFLDFYEARLDCLISCWFLCLSL